MKKAVTIPPQMQPKASMKSPENSLYVALMSDHVICIIKGKCSVD